MSYPTESVDDVVSEGALNGTDGLCELNVPLKRLYRYITSSRNSNEESAMQKRYKDLVANSLTNKLPRGAKCCS